MSDTPRTDKYIGHDNEDNMTEGEIAMCEFARKLERELTAANLALNAERAESAKQMLVIDGLKRELSDTTQNFEAEKERAEMFREQRDCAIDQCDKLIAAIKTIKEMHISQQQAIMIQDYGIFREKLND